MRAFKGGVIVRLVYPGGTDDFAIENAKDAVRLFHHAASLTSLKSLLRRIVLSRRTAVAQCRRSSSIPINGRPVSRAAASVEPEPQNGSKTIPPVGQNASISGFRLPTGFCVGGRFLPVYCHSSMASIGCAGMAGSPFASRYACSCVAPMKRVLEA